MESEHERVYKVLTDLASKTREGAYGEGNNFDSEALEQDIEEQLWENDYV